MMHSLDVPFIIFLEHREINNPEEVEDIIIQKTHLSCNSSSQETESCKHNLWSVAGNEDDITVLCFHSVSNFCQLFVIEELADR